MEYRGLPLAEGIVFYGSANISARQDRFLEKMIRLQGENAIRSLIDFHPTQNPVIFHQYTHLLNGNCIELYQTLCVLAAAKHMHPPECSGGCISHIVNT